MAPTPTPHPNAPRRGPVWLAFALVVVAGGLGAAIGSGLASASCVEEPSRLERLLSRIEGFTTSSASCTGTRIGATLAGAALAAIGAGIVAVLVLRAMSEWREHPPTPPAAPNPPASA